MRGKRRTQNEKNELFSELERFLSMGFSLKKAWRIMGSATIYFYLWRWGELKGQVSKLVTLAKNFLPELAVFAL